ncbi:MAG TPA: hypothetical protein VGR47_19460 [Terracidiphilus sp.]|nr:hypothetical protein [Terracidiphilus sp.]
MNFTESFQLTGNNDRMCTRLDRPHRSIPLLLSVAALAAVIALFAWDASPKLFPARSHDLLAAFSLAAIAIAYFTYEAAHRPSIPAMIKATLLALAFLFWAANQLWPALPQASLFNDIAIGLFVFDVFLVIGGWPPARQESSFAETGSGNCRSNLNSAAPSPQRAGPEADLPHRQPDHGMPVRPFPTGCCCRNHAEHLAENE